jgi:hypothetical protein
MQTIRTESKIKKERVVVYVSLGLAFAAMAAIGTSNLASATVENNLAGQEASELAQCDQDECVGEEQTNKGAMGQHSSDESSGGEQSHPRVGLGNVGEEILGSPEKLTPSEVIGKLCGEEGQNCP